MCISIFQQKIRCKLFDFKSNEHANVTICILNIGVVFSMRIKKNVTGIEYGE